MPEKISAMTMTVMTRAGEDARLGGGEGPLRHLGEGGAGGGFVREGLDRLGGEKRLGRAAGGGGDPVLVLAAEAPEAAAEKDDRHDHERHDQEHEPRELGRGEEQHRKPAHEDEGIAERDGDRGADDRQDQRRVGGDPAQHLARHDLLVEGGAHADHAVEDGLADVGHDPFAEAGDKVVARPRPQREEERDAEGREEVAVEQAFGRRLEPVHDAADGQRQDQGDERGEDERDDGGGKQAAVGGEEGPQRAERADALRLRPFPFRVRRLACHAILLHPLGTHTGGTGGGQAEAPKGRAAGLGEDWSGRRESNPRL